VKLTTANGQAAVEALARVLAADGAADRVLGTFFRERRQLGQGDRAVVAEGVYAVIRRLRTLEQACGGRDPRALLAAALLGPLASNAREVAQALHWPPERAETLRSGWHAVCAGASGALAVDLPDWIWERFCAEFGEAGASALSRSLLDPAPLDLRVNIALASRPEVLEQLAHDRLRAVSTPFAPYGVRLAEKPALRDYALFRDGRIEVQEEASQLVCHLLAPRRGEMVVDFCAGAGGKTLALAAMMRSSGRVYAFDVSARRLERLRPRLARSGVSNVHPQLIDGERDPRVGRLSGKIDRVLIDAPCSGLGTLRRNPELKWRQSPADVTELAAKQRAILEAACRLVKPGGRLVYATCSLLKEENQAVVAHFLEGHPEFGALDAHELLHAERIDLPLDGQGALQLLPHVHHTDGFFAAALTRLC
jgi:16S rRNA (cytosine967-C5)-methyltransferase